MQASDGYMIESSTTNPSHQWVGYFASGSYLCYDDIDLGGASSIDLQYARAGGHASFKIVAGNPENGQVLAEHQPPATGGWSNFDSMNVGFDTNIQGRYQLCFVGSLGSGIFNLDHFTLSDQQGTNTGPIDLDGGEIPNGPAVAPISVQGHQVQFGGQVGSIAGMSLFWSTGDEGAPFYTRETVKALKDEWGAKLVRAAMGVDSDWGSPDDPMAGYTSSEENRILNTLMVTEVVNAAIENGMYVIIDWHTHHGEQHTAAAIEFFTQMATKYGEYDNVIYEIYNEPLQVSWSDTIKPYAEPVIQAIRAVDPDNLIIVGTPAWSQDVDAASFDPINGFNNIAYTLHFYAGTHTGFLRDKATTAMANGIALFATEWGTVNADGDGGVAHAEVDVWMQFLKDNNISHANWSLCDKAEGSAALVPGASPSGNWSDSDLTESGRKAKSIIQSW